MAADGQRYTSPDASICEARARCLRVDILSDVRQFAIPNGDGEDKVASAKDCSGLTTARRSSQLQTLRGTSATRKRIGLRSANRSPPSIPNHRFSADILR
jgi:hypothetical protein